MDGMARAAQLLIYIVGMFFLGCTLMSPKTSGTLNDMRCPNSIETCAGAFQIDSKKVMDKYTAFIESTDEAKGSGLESADFYVANQLEPIRKTQEETVKPNLTRVVSFYQPLDSEGQRNRGGVSVQGLPTRVYLDDNSKPAYIAFDNQPVQLIEYTVDSNTNRVISGQDKSVHQHGFSMPLGPLKGVSIPLSEHSILDLRTMLGDKKQKVRLQFESGVVVEGIIKKYIENNSAAHGSPVVITFTECTVTFGKHMLFQPEWGDYDMLLANLVTNSSETLFRILEP